MKKRLVSFVLALLLLVGMALLQTVLTTPAPPENPVSIEQPDDGDTPTVQPTEGNQTPSTSQDPEAQNAPPEEGQTPAAGTSGTDGTDGTSGQPTSPAIEDDGIELGEGITDARAEQAAAAAGITVRKDGAYTSKVEVALYIHTYGRVPSNYVTKTKARNAGWVNTEGNLWDVLPGMSIGGGGYFNEQWGDEPLLPETPEGRDWRECDINYQGGYRGSERLVYSDDGLVFYTGDHYASFERLY